MTNITNCAVVAIAAVTGEPSEDIAAGIAAFPDEDGGPAFSADGVAMSAVSDYLKSRGWTELFFEHRPSIPLTAILWVPQHCFAVVDGRIYDGYTGAYDGAQILSIFVPSQAGNANGRHQ